MKAFITGSRAYGTHKPESDVDLVVFTDEATLESLKAFFGFPCRMGELNLIPVTSEAEYAAWLLATKRCQQEVKEKGELPKAAAISIHEKSRKMFGVPERFAGSGPSPEDAEEIREHKQTRNTLWQARVTRG